MKKLSKEQISEIINLYQSGISPKDIGAKFNIYNNSVTRILKKNNIERNQASPKIIITKEQEIYICEQYNNNISSEKIAKELNINSGKICKILKENNIKIRPSTENKRKYYLNDAWLDKIDDQYKAYFLGLFWADGSMSNHNNTFNIRLQESDKDILIKLSYIFYNFERLSYHEYEYEDNENNKRMACLYITSYKLHSRLQELGAMPNKCKIIHFPKIDIINNDLIPHFLRGLLDGDGCICVRENGKTTVDYTGNEFVIKEIKNILDNKNINNCYHYNNIKNSHSIQINNKENIKIFLDWIYKDANIYLIRKFNKYQEFLIKKPPN